MNCECHVVIIVKLLYSYIFLTHDSSRNPTVEAGWQQKLVTLQTAVFSAVAVREKVREDVSLSTLSDADRSMMKWILFAGVVAVSAVRPAEHVIEKHEHLAKGKVPCCNCEITKDWMGFGSTMSCVTSTLTKSMLSSCNPGRGCEVLRF